MFLNSPFRCVLGTAVVSFGLVLGPARAAQDQTYGLGGVTSGRVSSVTAEMENPFAALYNPALMAAQPNALFAFTASAAGSRYQTLKGVLVDSAQYRTQTGVPQQIDFTPASANMGLWAAGFTYPFVLPFRYPRRAGIGATLSGPFDRLRSFSSTTPYDFYPFRYGGSDSQFKATLGGALEVVPDILYFGGGFSVFISAAGNADANIAADNPTGRLSLDVSLNTALVLGLFAKLGENRASFIARQAVDPSFNQSFAGRAQIAQGTGTVVLPLNVTASLYYEPALFEADYQRSFGVWLVSAGVSYQRWQGFRAPFLVVRAPDANQVTRETFVPELQFRDTVNPRVSVQTRPWDTLTVTAGYQFRPSPLPDSTTTGPANLLDSQAHILGVSVGYKLKASSWMPLPLTFTLFGQYHWLAERTVTKADPAFVGSPNYAFGGNAHTYGLTLQADL